MLGRPLPVAGGSGRRVRYRFARQKSRWIAEALARLSSEEGPTDPHAMRTWLEDFRGIGPKTASWIVRNRTGSDRVAIVDVHLRRAGVHAGFFEARWRLPHDYAWFERAFLAVARLGRVRARNLDACIWGQLRRLGRGASRVLPRAADHPGRPELGVA